MENETIYAGGRVPKMASDIIGKTHREAYPEQYNDAAVGRYVRTPCNIYGTITRVVHTQWGTLGYLDDGGDLCWSLETLTIVSDDERAVMEAYTDV